MLVLEEGVSHYGSVAYTGRWVAGFWETNGTLWEQKRKSFTLKNYWYLGYSIQQLCFLMRRRYLWFSMMRLQDILGEVYQNRDLV